MHAVAQSIEEREALKARLLSLWERTGDASLQRLANGEAPRDGAAFATQQERTDWVNTCLMENYKVTGDAQVFALLFELNHPVFAIAVQGHMRRAFCHVDANDVLQDVFLNIYRYPHRFLSDRADAFRNWGHRIVRNTMLKAMRGAGRQARILSMDDEIQYADARAHSPEFVAIEGEALVFVNHAFVLYLSLYLLHFSRLSEKEQRALTMVEIDAASYRDAAAALGVRVENLKMVIFRGRRKIFRGMGRTLAAMGKLGETGGPDATGRPKAVKPALQVRQRVARACPVRTADGVTKQHLR